MKGKQPITSLEAYHSLDPDSVEAIKFKIVGALKIIKTGTSEEIASHLGMEHGKIWKRMSEAAKDGMIINTQSKRTNKSGRSAFVYSLPDEQTDLKPVEKVMQGKNVSDYSKTIQGIAKGTPLTLF